LDRIRYSKEVPCIEPDLGDLRKSTDKALPGLPKTPKRVLKKYRFSAVFPMVLAIASFILTLTLALAGHNAHTFGGQHLAAVSYYRQYHESQTPVYKNVKAFESSSATDTTETGNVYHIYLHKVCYYSLAHGSEVASDIFERTCKGYSTVAAAISASSSGTSTANSESIILGSRSLMMISTTLASVRMAVFASLIVSLVGSLLSTILAIPGIIYPHSRILAYMNIMWPTLASTF
ncbi:hypothetical protein COCSADRAFT_62033, partial [Bipolaris sorokiniana ND90Pr]